MIQIQPTRYNELMITKQTMDSVMSGDSGSTETVDICVDRGGTGGNYQLLNLLWKGDNSRISRKSIINLNSPPLVINRWDIRIGDRIEDIEGFIKYSGCWGLHWAVFGSSIHYYDISLVWMHETKKRLKKFPWMFHCGTYQRNFHGCSESSLKLTHKNFDLNQIENNAVNTEAATHSFIIPWESVYKINMVISVISHISCT